MTVDHNRGCNMPGCIVAKGKRLHVVDLTYSELRCVCIDRLRRSMSSFSPELSVTFEGLLNNLRRTAIDASIKVEEIQSSYQEMEDQYEIMLCMLEDFDGDESYYDRGGDDHCELDMDCQFETPSNHKGISNGPLKVEVENSAGYMETKRGESARIYDRIYDMPF